MSTKAKRPNAKSEGSLDLLFDFWLQIKKGWRLLAKMSTALWFLFAIALSVLVATFLPQEGISQQVLEGWLSGDTGPGEEIVSVLSYLGFFNVTESWWFLTLVTLLFTSLTICLIPRIRVFYRRVNRGAVRGRNLSRLTYRTEVPLGKGADVSKIITEATGRHKPSLLTQEGESDQYALDLGHLREGGSLLFHLSFYVLLIGMITYSFTGFTGQINIAEGRTFADTPLGYTQTEGGVLWSEDKHDGHLTTIDSFIVEYVKGQPFLPSHYQTNLTFEDKDGTVIKANTQVNHPAKFAGYTYFQRAFGFTTTISLKEGGRELFRDQLLLQPAGPMWTGRAKVSMGSENTPQVGMQVVFIPDGTFSGGTLQAVSPEPKNPRALVSLYIAPNLGLEKTVPVTSLIWEQKYLADQQMILPGQTIDFLNDEVQVTFEDLSYWTGLQVSSHKGLPVLAIAAFLMLVGLVLSLWVWRRRYWYEIHDDHIVLAGVALQRHDRFDLEFTQLKEQLVKATGTLG